MIYGRWMEKDGTLHYFDTEKGDVTIPSETKDEEYVVSVYPLPNACSKCPMYVDKGWDDLKDYCHLDCSIDVYWDSREFNEETQTYTLKRPDKCPLGKKIKVW